MKFVCAKEVDTDVLSAFWNDYAEGEILPKRMNSAQFFNLFIAPWENTTKKCLVAFDDDGGLLGFGAGTLKNGCETGYITYVLVEKSHRRKGIGRAIEAEIERKLKEASDTPLTRFEAVFYNPVGVSWCVPGTARHDHPGVPGVDMISEGYIWMKNLGFRDFAYQNSYYRKLEGFEYSDKVRASMAEAAKLGLSITYYDKNRHIGLAELFDNLNNPGWKSTILANEAKEKPLPLLVAEDASAGDGHAAVVGFTGPLYVQDSGRGYFAGIGVHTEYRSHGLGKALFSTLCSSLRDMGAEYMTLFTGETNPARNIYESAGFKIVRSWADMRKEIR